VLRLTGDGTIAAAGRDATDPRSGLAIAAPEGSEMFALATFVRAMRPVLLVVLGAVIGAGVAPAVAGVRDQAAQPTAIQTRSASCQGLNFHPIDYRTGFDYYGGEIRITQAGGSNFLLCDPGLPNRATVRKIQFTLHDESSIGEVRYCALYRSGLTPATALIEQVMALVGSTGISANPAIARFSSSSITHGLIDNTKWAYYLQCQINVPGQGYSNFLGIYGADVIYTISAANG
jgi:hypothetical protein